MKVAVLVVLSSVLAGTASPAVAAEAVADPVDVFVRSMAANQWDDAKPLVHGQIPQLTGIGPMVVGGPHSGQWQQRVVAGKDAVGAGDLVNALTGCTFARAQLLSGTAESPDKVVKMTFTCPVVYTVHFVVRRMADQAKVLVSDLGKDLVAVAAPTREESHK